MNRARKKTSRLPLFRQKFKILFKDFSCEVILNLPFDFGNQDKKYKTTKQFLQYSNDRKFIFKKMQNLALYWHLNQGSFDLRSNGSCSIKFNFLKLLHREHYYLDSFM